MIENDPAKTYTLTDFISMKDQDEITYTNFSILFFIDGYTLAQQCLLDYYLDELKSICLPVTLSHEEKVKYIYSPDLFAYDVYGSTQLDFVVLLCNGMIDPKEFDFKHKYLKLPKAADLQSFLSMVYNAESSWKNLNTTEIKTAKTTSI